MNKLLVGIGKHLFLPNQTRIFTKEYFLFYNMKRKNKVNNNQKNKFLSPVEKLIATELKKLRIPFQREYQLPTSNKRYDFCLTERRILIEYDGIDYHDTPMAMLNDLHKDQLAIIHNYTLIRVNKFNLTDFLKGLNRYKAYTE